MQVRFGSGRRHAFAALPLLSTTGGERNVEILALRYHVAILQRQFGSSTSTHFSSAGKRIFVNVRACSQKYEELIQEATRDVPFDAVDLWFDAVEVR